MMVYFPDYLDILFLMYRSFYSNLGKTVHITFMKCFQMIIKHYSIWYVYSMRHAIFLKLDGIWQDLLLWMEN